MRGFRPSSTCAPSTSTRPLVGLKMFISMRIDVVLPAPLLPRMPKIVPRGTSNEMPFTAVKSPKRLVTSWKRTAGWSPDSVMRGQA